MNARKIGIIFATLLPLTSFAAGSGADLNGLGTLFGSALSIINSTLIPLFIGLAILAFFWGMVQFLRNSGDAKAREEGKQKMIWGVIAIFVMVSIFGIIKLIGSTLGIDQGGSASSLIPTIQ